MTSGDKQTVEKILEVISGSGLVTIANNPKTMDYLPEGAPVEPVSGAIGEFKLIKGLELFEAVTTGLTFKVKKTNLLGIGDTIKFDIDTKITAIDTTLSDEYDLVTGDAAVTGVLGVFYSEDFTKAYITSGGADIDNDLSNVSVGVVLRGTVRLGKMNLKAPLTNSTTANGIEIWEEIWA